MAAELCIPGHGPGDTTQIVTVTVHRPNSTLKVMVGVEKLNVKVVVGVVKMNENVMGRVVKMSWVEHQQ
jgi:hypothetical protein